MSRAKMEKYFLHNYIGGCERKYKQQYKLFALKIDVSCDYIKSDSPRHFLKEQSLQSCIETFGLGYVIRDGDQHITVITLDKEKDKLICFLNRVQHKYVAYNEIVQDRYVVV